jgi:hypothetical protein
MTRIGGLARALGVASVFSTLPAAAQGKIDLGTEAPEPAVARSYHVHDGFYLRGAMGFGAFGADFDDDSAADIDPEARGGSFALDLMIGGSPSRGLAIGGALLTDTAVGANYEVDGTESGDGSIGTGLLGAFIDGFPDPKGGFHLGGALGYTTLIAEGRSLGDENLETAGFGGAFFIGYDFWVGDEWSMGPLLRVMATANRDRDDELDVSAASRSISLSFTALYH